MCITFFIVRPNHPNPLVLAFNRDEMLQRESLPFGFFLDDVNIFAGRDVKSGGTCVGFNKLTGLLVILTNFDMPEGKKNVGRSRGKLVRSFLKSDFVPNCTIPQQLDDKVTELLECHLSQSLHFSPHNLIVANLRTSVIQYICSEFPERGIEKLQTNRCYGLCNGHLHNLYPKTKHGLLLFEKIIQNSPNTNSSNEANESGLNTIGQIEALAQLMANETPFSENPDDESSIFIRPYTDSQGYQRLTLTTLILVGEAKECGIQLNCRELFHNWQMSPSSQVDCKVNIDRTA